MGTSSQGSALDTRVLLFKDLQVLSGKTRLAWVERWARSQGIPYKYDGNGGIWTTIDAINFALGIPNKEAPRHLRPEDIF